MKIGYPCINTGLGCTASSTFRLASYSEERLLGTVQENLDCLERMLAFGVSHNLFFLGIGSGIVPFASHPICKKDWTSAFGRELLNIGAFARKYGFRISMHPDKSVVLNSRDRGVVERSIAELNYHCKLLDSMGLDSTAKIQVPVGGVYGDRYGAMERFVDRYQILDESLKKRLVVENNILFSLKDCLEISKKVGVPVLFDVLHHECNNNGEPLRKAVEAAAGTWRKRDGPLMVDYSQQKKDGKKGEQAETLTPLHFRKFLRETEGPDFDLMVETKNREKSALKALRVINTL